jgi:hypothetical protein
MQSNLGFGSFAMGLANSKPGQVSYPAKSAMPPKADANQRIRRVRSQGVVG